MPFLSTAANEMRSSDNHVVGSIRGIPASWYRPSRPLYWTDLLVTALIGWVSFAETVRLSSGLRLLSFSVTTFALYRAVLFIHELAHVNRRDLPHFELVWNLLIGLPLLVPSFLYQNVHLDHHRQKTYGTQRDPEYLPFAHRPLTAIVLYALGALLFPLALVVRFGLLAPVSWANTRIRKMTVERCSALIINYEYVRRKVPDGPWWLQELACTSLCWIAALSWCVGWVPGRVFLWWGIVGSAVSSINAVRALSAHRYDHDGTELTSMEQLLDSCTLTQQHLQSLTGLVAAWQALWAPVGLRYHALHHWIPALPYHNLGRAHRLLLTAIDDQLPYRATLRDTMWATVADLISRSLRRRP